MATYSITIDEKIPQGKALITLLKNMDAVVIKKVKSLTKEATSESPYDPAFVAKVKRAYANADFKQIDADKIWESI